MKVLLGLLVVAAFACSGVEMKKKQPLQPWEIRNQIRDVVEEIREVVDDISDEECLERSFGHNYLMKPTLVKDVKDILKTLQKTRKMFQCTPMEMEKRRPPMDSDPCKQHIRIGFNETMNENGTMVLEAKVVSNTSVQQCDPAKSWISLQDLRQPNQSVSAEFLLRQCPPAPGCGDKLRSFNNTNRIPSYNETSNVTFNMEFEGECAVYNNMNTTVEMMVCPDGKKLFRLPMKCNNGKLCGLKRAMEGEGMEGEDGEGVEEGNGEKQPEGTSTPGGQQGPGGAGSQSGPGGQ